MQYLHEANLYEPQDQMLLRQEVMGQLDLLAKQWVRLVTEHLALGDHMVAEANARIYTFGSYRLGVHGPGIVLLSATECTGHICQLFCMKACCMAVPPIRHAVVTAGLPDGEPILRGQAQACHSLGSRPSFVSTC